MLFVVCVFVYVLFFVCFLFLVVIVLVFFWGGFCLGGCFRSTIYSVHHIVNALYTVYIV